MTTVTDTFWNGYRGADVSEAHTFIPAEGRCPKGKPASEDWRLFSRMYYRYYNDGDRPHHARLKRLAGIAGVSLVSLPYRLHYGCRPLEVAMEEIGAKLLDRALAEVRGSAAA